MRIALLLSLSPTAMSMTRDEVISTPELLEHIVALLPLRDLLVAAPLVSRTWQRHRTLAGLLVRHLLRAGPRSDRNRPESVAGGDVLSLLRPEIRRSERFFLAR